MKKVNQMSWGVLGVCGIFFGVSELWASHFLTCAVEAKVEEIKRLGRLDDHVVFSRDQSIPSDYEEVAVFEIQHVTHDPDFPRGQCGYKAGEKVELHVKKDQQGKYKKDDVLYLHFQNVGDARASRVSWVVSEPR